MTAASPLAAVRRRDRQREETRRDLALAAFELASAHGLAAVRVPDIAANVGVSTRTFNNYFASKEAAIIWPAVQRGSWMADRLRGRPDGEPLADAIVAAVIDGYDSPPDDGLPPGWLHEFRALVAREPALHGEYLKASAGTEESLAAAIAERLHGGSKVLRSHVLAAMVVGAERAAVRHWIQQGKRLPSLLETVRAAAREAVAGVDGKP